MHCDYETIIIVFKGTTSKAHIVHYSTDFTGFDVDIVYRSALSINPCKSFDTKQKTWETKHAIYTHKATNDSSTDRRHFVNNNDIQSLHAQYVV